MSFNLTLDVGFEELRIEDELSRADLKAAQLLKKDLVAAGCADRPMELHVGFDQGEGVVELRAVLHVVESSLDPCRLRLAQAPFRQGQIHGETLEDGTEAEDLTSALRRELCDFAAATGMQHDKARIGERSQCLANRPARSFEAP